jgi:hypothetical protein
MLINKVKNKLRLQQANLKDTLESLIQIKIRNDLIFDTKPRLLSTKDSLRGRTVFCVGNGPSLTDDQLRLASKHAFVATNRAYQLFDSSAFSLGGNGWLMINDYHRSLEILPALTTDYQQVVVGCWKPKNIYLYKVLMKPPWLFANCAWGLQLSSKGVRCLATPHQLFSDNFAHVYYCGRSVIFSAIQFAAYLGAKRIVLIGCDMDYSGPLLYSAKINGKAKLFEFNYLEDGMPHMISCRDGLHSMGIQIYNASIPSAINEISMISYEDLCALLRCE